MGNALPHDPSAREIARLDAQLATARAELVTLAETLATTQVQLADAQQALDMAIGPHCSGCGNSIDPECCWCGDGPAATHYDETHGFIPMGCDCARGDRDWKKAASALREQTWQLRKALRAALAVWCPKDPGGDGADGDTYHLAKRALGEEPAL